MGHLSALTSCAVLALAVPVAAQELAPYGQGEPASAIDMSLPGPNVHMDRVDALLPKAGELENPAGYAEARDQANELAQDSEARTVETLKNLARDLAPDTASGDEPSRPPPAQPRRLPEDRRVTVLVSEAMGEGELRRLFAAYAGRPDVRFAFRGVGPGSSVPDFAYWLQELLPAPDAVDVTLDPELFALVGTEYAPTVVVEDTSSAAVGADPGSDIGEIVASAQGHADPDWVWERVAAGQTDLNRPTGVPITEEDLRVRAERELAEKLDGLTRDPEILIGRFWQRQAAALEETALPTAELARLRVLTFGFEAPEDITDAEGNVLAFKGERFEPQDVLPFDRQMLVIDPTSQDQVDWAAARLQSPREGVIARIVLLTRIPPVPAGADPWSGLEALISRFGVKVFLVNANLRSSFDLRTTPTEIFPHRGAERVEVLSAEGFADPRIPAPGQEISP